MRAPPSLLGCGLLLLLSVLLGAAQLEQEAQLEHQHDGHAYLHRHLRHRPKPSELAATARWLMHASSWGVLSTISSTTGAPFGNPQSVADGPLGEHGLFGDNSTGIPYFFVSELDVSQIDIAARPETPVSFTMSEAALPGGCARTDPESPLCVRLSITGTMTTVVDEQEKAFAMQALFQRHPAMQGWPTDHSWEVKKLEPTHLFVLDMFGGAKPLSVEDYLAVEL